MAAPVRALALLLLALLGALLAGAAPSRAESFPMPASLGPRVDFWTRVYTEVGTNGGFVHDNADLSLVYEVVRVPVGSSERSLDAQVEAAKSRVRAALRKLGSGQRSGLSAAERRILALFPPDVSSRTLLGAAERVRFQRGQADKFREGLKRQGRWEGYIRRALRERGVPEDLKALPHVESSYNPSAHSHAGASGLWQFTRPTGRLYMRVDHIVDERRDPFHASEAAARLLRSNYERLGTWPLAITAYNHGPGGLAKAVRQLGTRDIGTIVARYRSPSFGFASRNFYAEFLAARRIDQNPERYFGPLRRDAPADHESVVLRKSYGVGALAKALRIPSQELREWNPALLSPVWSGARSVPASYEVRIPRRGDQPAASALVAGVQGQGYRGAPALAARPLAGGVYRVKRGETLGEIAQRHGTSSAELAALNGIRNPRQLREGQVLELPGDAAIPIARAETAAGASGASASGAAASAAAASAAGERAERLPSGAAEEAIAARHRVAAGETLLEIARRYEVSMARIAARNEIRDPAEIVAGQILEIPGAPRAAEPAAELARAEPAPAPSLPAGSSAASGPAPAGPTPSPAPQGAQAGAASAGTAGPADPLAAPDAGDLAAGNGTTVSEAAPVEPEPAAAERSPDPAPAPAPPLRHVVEPGDTLASIARRFGTSATALAAANGIDDPRRLRPGMILEIGAEGARAPARPAPPPPERYRVRAGDTLGSIARRTGTSARRLAAANGIDDPRRLQPGQVLVLPGGGSAKEHIYVVRAGDTLYSIAARHGVRVADLARYNGLRDRHKLSIGQRLQLPPEQDARRGGSVAEGS